MNPAALTDALVKHMADEISCSLLDDRLVCDTSLYYPNGDSVVVFVTEHAGLLEVTDYSEGMALAMERLHRRSGVLATVGQRVCAGMGLTFVNGRVSTVVPLADLPDAVWRVASASLRIADAVEFELAKPEREKRDFSQEVEHELVLNKVSLERTKTIVGQSGHKHRPTFFVPSAQALVEPIGADAHWTRATAVYALFGDIMKVNGYARVAVIDDRGDHVNDDVQNLLQQVGSLVYWTDRAPWIGRVSD
jgi:hypothetical protein